MADGFPFGTTPKPEDLPEGLRLPEGESHKQGPNSPAPTACPCWSCLTVAGVQVWWMVVCDTCGNKRCPHAMDHRNQCSGSNEPGQLAEHRPAPLPVPMFEDRKRHALLNVALCGARATLPDNAEAEDCEPCVTALAELPEVRPEPRVITYEQVYNAWHGRPLDEPWGGCADREAIERVMQLISGQESHQ